ncbi:MAG: C39 family peptidase [Gammaproteobacteria bacterium]|nr:C39 family peptidase [Gammaproteobacteria bacterium]
MTRRTGIAALLAVAAVGGVCAAQTARAGNVGFGNVIPGAGVIHTQVVSLRASRFVDMVRQHTDYSCGAAALATILKYAYGENTNEQQVLRGMLAVSNPEIVRRKGFSLLDIKHYVESLGMQGVGYKVPLVMLPRVKVPTIVLLNIKGYEHFVVLKKVVGDEVYLADPALGNRTLSLKSFTSGWNGILFAVVGKRYEPDTVLVHIAPPLSARRLLTVMAPSAPVTALDYGYGYSTLF